jgi:hypothetical protein
MLGANGIAGHGAQDEAASLYADSVLTVRSEPIHPRHHSGPAAVSIRSPSALRRAPVCT